MERAYSTEVQRLAIAITKYYNGLLLKMQELNEIFKDFSHNRLLTYKHFLKFELSHTNYTPEQVYNLYGWNEEIASSFWLLLSRIEITLRNRINDIFVEKFGKFWLDTSQYHNTKVFFKDTHKKQIEKSENKLSNKGITPTNDRMVAELNMGFWVSFSEIGFSFDSDELKENEIGWKYFIPKIMTGYQYPNKNSDKVRYWSKQGNIANLVLRLDVAKEIRNRIAHHEPIFNYIPSHLSSIPKDELGDFLKVLQNTYQYLLGLLHDLSPQQARIYQKSHNHYQTLYLLSNSTFDKYLNLGSADDMMLLEKFIEYLMDYMEEEKDNQTMVHISHNNSYFGCFIPKR